MKFDKLSKVLRGSLSLVLALFMLFSMFGCSMAEIADNAELAGNIIDIVGELMEETAEYDVLIDTSDDDYYEETEPLQETEAVEATASDIEFGIDREGYYYSKDDVALYIHIYGELPANFITKEEASELGWEGGSLECFLEGAAIGGDEFKNREGNLPKAGGRTYYECDIDTDGKDSRGAKRIVFSNDGLIYYTDDHYESFTLLYGEE